ncbi:VanZ family protein [Sphingomonas nostoxanthinifaciens]|uniref:teicoplanin resistance protein VanZ n=1 Tax=Sphingomonas nostoxanthinifaciens TaxID=2872652 RepID=UPI001CC2177B|nr:teicoplanin resistance protein VanZ [Sphingomonas nostoxanthinifaciens]UAK25351.1 teicoplanin resistance protein VanZ [Sphingomonas nostoxanthinifaciens]
MPPLRRICIILFWLAVIVAYVAAILPQREAPHLGYSDKVDHMAAFFTITVLARLGYPERAVPLVFIAMAAFGGFIELSQAVPIVHRDAEWADWFADMAASVVGLIVAWPLLALIERWSKPQRL